jgi:protein-S-isoprenylcysteine O-methyltransferase Ste14
MSALWDRLPLPAEHVVGVLAALALQRRTPGSRLPAALAPAGWPLIATGAAMNGWAVVARGAGDLERPDRLVTDGPHAWTRNPMYLGWSLMHVGLGIALRSPWVLASWPVAFAFVHHAVLREERRLAIQFGQEFNDYRERVGRYWGAP